MIEKRNTTITVKLRTKYKLDEYKEGSESYDDAIIRSLNELKRLRMEKEMQDKFIRDKFGNVPNKMEFLDFERSKRALILTDMTVYYTYNKPPVNPPPEGYIMGITVEEIKKDNEMVHSSLSEMHPQEAMDIYLMIVSDLIKNHFDKTYAPPSRVNIIDRYYWEIVYKKYSLPWSSFREDIEESIERFESDMNDLEMNK